MLKNCLNSPAPSMRAASYNSVGMETRPRRHHDQHKGGHLPPMRDDDGQQGGRRRRHARKLRNADPEKVQNPVQEAAVRIVHVAPDQSDDDRGDQQGYGIDSPHEPPEAGAYFQKQDRDQRSEYKIAGRRAEGKQNRVAQRFPYRCVLGHLHVVVDADKVFERDGLPEVVIKKAHRQPVQQRDDHHDQNNEQGRRHQKKMKAVRFPRLNLRTFFVSSVHTTPSVNLALFQMPGSTKSMKPGI